MAVITFDDLDAAGGSDQTDETGGAAAPDTSQAPAPAESEAGTPPAPAKPAVVPAGLRNNNPGNIRADKTKWQGQTGANKGFATFGTPEDGIRAAAINLQAKGEKHGLTTVAGIIGDPKNGWAPPNENDTPAYVAQVAAELGVKPDDPLDLSDPNLVNQFLGAIFTRENGKNPYTPQQMATGVKLATGKAPTAGAPAASGGPITFDDLDVPKSGPITFDDLDPPKPTFWQGVENWLTTNLKSGKGPGGSVASRGIANVAQGETGELTPFAADKSTAGAFVQGFAEGGAPMGEMGPAAIDWMQQHGWSPTDKNLNLINATTGYLMNAAGYTGGELLNAMSKVFSGGLSGFHQGLTNVLTGAGMDPQSASDFAREVTGYFEIEGSRGGGHPELVPRVEVPDWAKPTPPPKPKAQERPNQPRTPPPQRPDETDEQYQERLKTTFWPNPPDSGLGKIGLARPGEPPPPSSVLPTPILKPAPKVPGPPRPEPDVTAAPSGEGGIPRRVIADDVAVTSTGREVPVQYAVVEASHLVPSQTLDGVTNKDFPAELQPRDRSRAVSQQQVATIAQNLNPRLLDKSPTASDGAPIISATGVVESGNGRTLAIQRAYADGSEASEGYRQYLKDQGYPVDGMTAPVLVRVRNVEMTPEERGTFVREANKSGVSGYSVTEQAMADANALDDAALDLYTGGDVQLVANRPFVREFISRAVTPAEYGELVGADGSLSKKGIARVQTALLAKAYGDPALVEKVAESPDSDIKAIGGALLDIAPEWARLRAAVRRGSVPAEMDQTANLIAAANLVERARQEGVKLKDLTSQVDAFTGKAIDPLTESWLRLMFRDTDDWKRPTGRKSLADAVRLFAEEAKKAVGGENLLGLPPTSPADILALAKKRQELGGQPDNTAGLSGNGEGFRSPGGQGAGPEVPGNASPGGWQTAETGGTAGAAPGPGPVESFPRDQTFKFTRGLKAAMSNITTDVRAYAARLGVPLAYEPVNGARVGASFVMERGRQTGNESMVIVHSNGGIEAHTSEQPEAVTFGPTTIAMWEDPQTRIVSLHNHPSGAGPSEPDVVALNYPGHLGMVVIGQNGDFHVATLARPMKNVGTKFSQPVGRLEFQLAAYNAGKAADKYGYPIFERGEMHPDEGRELRAYIRNAALDRAGLIDYTTNYEVPARHRGWVEQAIEEAASGIRESLKDSKRFELAPRRPSGVYRPPGSVSFDGTIKEIFAGNRRAEASPGNGVRPENGPGRTPPKAYRKPTQIKLLEGRDSLREEEEKITEPGAVDAHGRALPQYVFPGMEKATETEALIHKNADAATRERIEADLQRRSDETATRMKAEEHTRTIARRQAEQYVRPKSEKSREPDMFGPPPTKQKSLFQLQAAEKPFFSALTRAVETSKTAKATGAQWLATLRNTPGIKSEEMEWSHIEDFLRGQTKPITRDELLAHAREHEVHIQEHVGGEPWPPEKIAEFQRRYEDIVNLRDRGGQMSHHEAERRLKALNDEFGPHEYEGLPSYGKITTPTRFGNWRLAGGKNYRELRMTLPHKAQDLDGELKNLGYEVLWNDDGTFADGVKRLSDGAEMDWTELPEGRAREISRRIIQGMPEMAETGTFRTSHWNEPNILAHVRFDERTGPNGERILHTAEIQSDWHQRGRREGYAGDPARIRGLQAEADEAAKEYAEAEAANDAALAAADAHMDRPHPSMNLPLPELRRQTEENQRKSAEISARMTETIERLTKARNRDFDAKRALREAQTTGLPNAPFKTAWHELAFKRLLRYAAEHGYDRLSWDNGDVNAERYDLSKHIDRVTLQDNTSGGIGEAKLEGPFEWGLLSAYDKNGKKVIDDRHVRSPEEIADHIGKEAAEKLLNAKPTRQRSAGLGVRERRLDNADLKVGGKGMREFYDKIIPQFANKYVKKWGSKVEDTHIETVDRELGGYMGPTATLNEVREMRKALHDRGETVQIHQQLEDVKNQMEVGGSFEQAMSDHGSPHLARLFGGEMAHKTENVPVHSVRITPEMRESLMRGQPLFERGRKGAEEAGTGLRRPVLLDDVVAELPHNPSLREREVIAQVGKIANRIVPKAEVIPARRIMPADSVASERARGQSITGATTQGTRKVIAWSLASKDPVHTLRHEAIHWLRHSGFITASEWSKLVDAARKGDWIGKYNIASRYRDLHADGQIEEAIAEHFAAWRKAPGIVPVLLRPIFEKLARLLDKVRDHLQTAFGGDVTARNIFSRIESGEIGNRDRTPRIPHLGVDLPPAKSGPQPFGRRTQFQFNPDNLPEKLQDPARSAQEIVRNFRMLLAPMAEGGDAARAVVKDWANRIRLAHWHGQQMDKRLKDRFTPEQRKRMWEAADEESVARQQGRNDMEGIGLNRLTAEERDEVLAQQRDAEMTWEAAKAVGLVRVENEGLPSYVPRMFVDMAEGGAKPLRGNEARSIPGYGRQVRTSTPNLKQRKYLTTEESEAAASAKFDTEAKVVRDIRTLPLATMKLREAVAGRALINAIKEAGRQVGEETVVEGAPPFDPEHRWFTIDGNPAFTTWRPRFTKDPDTGRYTAMKDESGNTVFERVPVHVRDDWEGPLRSVLASPDGAAYQAFMTLKGKAMNNVMFSPFVQLHLLTELGRALPADPKGLLTFKGANLKILAEGNLIKNDPEVMTRAILAGLVPIGRHFEMQDITGVAASEQIRPGRSWTAQILGAVPGLFDPKAGEKVYRSVDAMGDFLHNTLLWDRVADLQAGLFKTFSDNMVAKGYDQQTADRMAAHWANRYAGTLPREAMSQLSRKIANVVLFSRTYTLGNLAVVKDMINGLPRDLQAQILRDAGAETLSKVTSLARRKTIAIVAIDVAMMYAANSLLTNGIAYLTARSNGDQIWQDYVDRLKSLSAGIKAHPLRLLNPFIPLDLISATATNEIDPETGMPLRRVLIGYDKQGTAIYARNPLGKFAEEYANWTEAPLATLKSKLSPFARPTLDMVSNNAGIGDKKLWQPSDSPEVVMGKIIGHYIEAFLPMDQIESGYNILMGQARSTDAAKLALRTVGVTVRRGYPGGPAAGFAHDIRSQHEQAIQAALPDIHRQYDSGDKNGAARALAKLGMTARERVYLLRSWATPASRARAPRYATPDQRNQLRTLQKGQQ